MSEEVKKPRASVKVIESDMERLNSYEDDFLFKERQLNKPEDVRTTVELIAFLESHPDVGLDAKVIGHTQSSGLKIKKIEKEEFITRFKESDNESTTTRFKEAFDGFDGAPINQTGNLVGQDFVPLLGGPFYKQLYYYNDYLLMHQNAYFAYNHDPMARATIDILVNFTMGKGYRVDCEDDKALAIWRAFEEVNNLPELMMDFAKELSIYGENMIWWLPNNATSILYPFKDMKTEIPHGLIPRIRLLDPSNINEIITRPEDINHKLFYVWLTPTQYQIYTAKDKETGKVVPSSKFIYQQIPANQIDHYKINSVSNEKRGRSDLFPVLGYGKRLRDSVNYEIIKQQKNAAWSIDTTVEGDQNDLDNYVADQQALGTIPQAGSEFVHTKAIQRQYLGSAAGGKSVSSAFEWCASMYAAGTKIPLSYYGLHLSGGQTRASALVATEPVAKHFEMRQMVYERVIKAMSRRLFKMFGYDAEIEVTFPEIITQDRSAKLKDLFLAETAEWISNERAATIAAKEFGASEYEYDDEKEAIRKEKSSGDFPPIISAGATPLTTPPGLSSGKDQAPSKPSAVTGEEKKQVKDNYGF